MMKKSLGGLVFAGVLLTAVQASAQSASSSEVAQCAQRTHAPGSYEITNRRVVAGVGGTERGVRNVEDCIADLRGIQYGSAVDGSSANPTTLTEQACRRQRDTGYAASVAATVLTVAILGNSDGVLTGATAGAGRSIGRTVKRYRTCLEAVSIGTSVVANGSVVSEASCTRRGNPMVGGTGYCRR